MVDSPLVSHPSFLELDRAALGTSSQATLEHLKNCPCCATYVQKLHQPLPIPNWLTELGQTSPTSRSPRSWKSILNLWGGVAALACGLLLVFSSSRFFSPDNYTAPKGMPGVALYVKSTAGVFLWQEKQAVVPGDSLRLEVSPENFKYLTVTASGASDQLEILYQGRVYQNKPFLLPASWRVDEALGTEILAIFLSQEPLSSSEITHAKKTQQRNDQVWTTVLHLPKKMPGR